jgi:hypothetical protein
MNGFFFRLCVSLAIVNDLVAPIYCTIPNFSSQVPVNIVHVEKSNIFCVRALAIEELANQLLDDMYEFYATGGMYFLHNYLEFKISIAFPR